MNRLIVSLSFVPIPKSKGQNLNWSQFISSTCCGLSGGKGLTVWTRPRTDHSWGGQGSWRCCVCWKLGKALSIKRKQVRRLDCLLMGRSQRPVHCSRGQVASWRLKPLTEALGWGWDATGPQSRTRSCRRMCSREQCASTAIGSWQVTADRCPLSLHVVSKETPLTDCSALSPWSPP